MSAGGRREIEGFDGAAAPRASVVVPVRNRCDLLAQALDALTAQDFPADDYEIIVCDDGSTEDVSAVVARFAVGALRVRMESQPPLGPAAARNLGIRASSAPVIVFVDSDVVVDRALVRLLVEALDAQDGWQGAEAALHPAGAEAGLLWDAPSSAEGGRYHTAAIAYRRTVLLAAGGFDEGFLLPACEDVELAMRVLGGGPIGFVPEARAWHPCRRITARTHWRWRLHWRYELVLALRYGILAFPGKSAGRFPRLRVAWAAVVSLPAGRLLAALKAFARSPRDAVLAALYAVFDVVCGLSAVPLLLSAKLPPRRDYLAARSGAGAAVARTAVVIVAHRSYATLGLCLEGFQAIVDDPADLIFVDNGSGGVMTEWVRQHFPEVTVLTLEINRLFCGGYNAGIRHAMDRGYDQVLIANADTEVANPDFLSLLVAAMDRHPTAAFAGPLVYFRDRATVQRTCLQFPSLVRSALIWLPYRLLPARLFQQPDREREVQFLNGVCVLCRVQALREIGLMDETFGGYVEDTDWSWRARKLGWSSLFTPIPSIVHHEEPHGYEHHSFKSFLLKRNTVHWLLKAGKRRSARGYALAAVVLAWARAGAARSREERTASRDFARKLQIVYRRLLSGDALGPWYGPPMDKTGTWNPRHTG